MKRGDFVVYGSKDDVQFGRVCKVQGALLTIIPTNKEKRTVKRLASCVVSQEFLLDRLRSLNEIKGG